MLGNYQVGNRGGRPPTRAHKGSGGAVPLPFPPTSKRPTTPLSANARYRSANESRASIAFSRDSKKPSSSWKTLIIFCMSSSENMELEIPRFSRGTIRLEFWGKDSDFDSIHAQCLPFLWCNYVPLFRKTQELYPQRFVW